MNIAETNLDHLENLACSIFISRLGFSVKMFPCFFPSESIIWVNLAGNVLKLSKQ